MDDDERQKLKLRRGRAAAAIRGCTVVQKWDERSRVWLQSQTGRRVNQGSSGLTGRQTNGLTELNCCRIRPAKGFWTNKLALPEGKRRERREAEGTRAATAAAEAVECKLLDADAQSVTGRKESQKAGKAVGRQRPIHAATQPSKQPVKREKRHAKATLFCSPLSLSLFLCLAYLDFCACRSACYAASQRRILRRTRKRAIDGL